MDETWEHIDKQWIRKVLHTSSDRERFADVLSGSEAKASRGNKSDGNGDAEGRGKGPVYYVYGLFDKAQWDKGIRIPFYIGKGTDQRVFSHAAEAIQYWKEKNNKELEQAIKREIKSIEDANADYNDSPENQSKAHEEEKQAKCERILSCKEGIVEGVFKFGLYENEAFWVEDALIKAYNLIKIHPLFVETNMSNSEHLLKNAVAGHRTAYEKLKIGSSIDEIQTLDDVLDKIALEPIELKTIREDLNATRLLIIKIGEAAYDIAMQKNRNDENKKKEWIMDQARGYWNTIVKENDYAVVVLEGRGRIVGVYEIVPFEESGVFWIDLRSPAKDVKVCDYESGLYREMNEEVERKIKEALDKLLKEPSKTESERIEEIRNKLEEELKFFGKRKHWKFYNFKSSEKANKYIGKRPVVLLEHKTENPRYRRDTARATFFWEESTEQAWEKAYKVFEDRLFDEEDIKTNQTQSPLLHLDDIYAEEKARIEQKDETGKPRGTYKPVDSKSGKWRVEF